MSTAQRITRWLCLPLFGLFLATSTLDATLLRPHTLVHWIAQTALPPLMLIVIFVRPAMRRTLDGEKLPPMLKPRWSVAVIAALCVMLAIELAMGATDLRHLLLLGLVLVLIAGAAVLAAAYARWKTDTRYLPRIG